MKFDKLLHGLSCYAISTVAFLLFLSFGTPWLALVVGTLVSALVGVGKEWYDKKHTNEGHSFEKSDLLADGLGLLVALALELAVVLNLAA